MFKVKRFGFGKDITPPTTNKRTENMWLVIHWKNKRKTNTIWSTSRITAGIAHSGYYHSNRYEVSFVLASVGEAWHSVLHLCMVLPDSRNRQKQTVGNKAVWRPLALFSSLQRVCETKKREKRLWAPPRDTPALHTIWHMQTVNDKYSESCSAAHTGSWRLPGNISQICINL